MVKYLRKVIKIRGEHSPNVRYALAQQAAGQEATGDVIVPGVLTWQEYQVRRKLWSPQRQHVSLDAEFWEGADELMYPPEWMAASAAEAELLKGVKRRAIAVGVDPGEGRANSTWTAVDELGIVEQRSERTPDTSVVPKITVEFAFRHGVAAENVGMDMGGGGRQHADVMAARGFKVRLVGFGQTISTLMRRGKTPFAERVEVSVERYVYVNRRAQMYGELRELLDPRLKRPFAIPEYLTLLREQMSVIPLTKDQEGRFKVLPKRKKDVREPDDPEQSLTELIGYSPDELDSTVLAVHCMLHDPPAAKLGVAF